MLCCIRDDLKVVCIVYFCRVLLSGALKDWSKRLVLLFYWHFVDLNFSNNIYFLVALQIKESEKELDLELKETRS